MSEPTVTPAAAHATANAGIVAAAAKTSIVRLSGAAIAPYLDDLVQLRAAVARDQPPLYGGTLAYENANIGSYARCAQSVVVLALADAGVIGAATGMPLVSEALFRVPFELAGYDATHVFCGGEPVLLPAYRGSSVYRQLFLQREAYARELGFTTIAFGAVERGEHHGMESRDDLALDAAWGRYGYTKHPELTAHSRWQDASSAGPSEMHVVFWLKALPAAK